MQNLPQELHILIGSFAPYDDFYRKSLEQIRHTALFWKIRRILNHIPRFDKHKFTVSASILINISEHCYQVLDQGVFQFCNSCQCQEHGVVSDEVNRQIFLKDVKDSLRISSNSIVSMRLNIACEREKKVIEHLSDYKPSVMRNNNPDCVCITISFDV